MWDPFVGAPGWVVVLAYISGALLSLGVIFKVVRAFVTAFNKLDRLLTVIDPVTRIAEDFKRNGGHSLRDAVDRIDKAAETAATNAEVAVKMSKSAADEARNLKTDVSELGTIVRHSAQAMADNGRLLTELRGHSMELGEQQQLILERGRILRRGDLSPKGNAEPTSD